MILLKESVIPPRFLALSRHRRICGILPFNVIAILGSTSFIGYLVATWIGSTLKNSPSLARERNATTMTTRTTTTKAFWRALNTMATKCFSTVFVFCPSFFYFSLSVTVMKLPDYFIPGDEIARSNLLSTAIPMATSTIWEPLSKIKQIWETRTGKTLDGYSEYHLELRKDTAQRQALSR